MSVKFLNNTNVKPSQFVAFVEAVQRRERPDTAPVIKGIRNLKAAPEAAYNTLVDANVDHTYIRPVLAAVEQRFGW